MAGRVKPIPVPVILAAVNGDEDALAAVVAHYQSCSLPHCPEYELLLSTYLSSPEQIFCFRFCPAEGNSNHLKYRKIHTVSVCLPGELHKVLYKFLSVCSETILSVQYSLL